LLAAQCAIAGVDGCKGGWVAVALHPDSSPETVVHATIADLVEALPADAVIAVDMPIGLPERAAHGGRGPETLVRRFLGERQSSVFSIPSRGAVYAEPDPFDSVEEWYAAHRRAYDVARATSEPSRGVSIQAFGIFPRSASWTR
jgi:predicted RNase H-like nuclease